MDKHREDGITHTPGQSPSATSVCIHQAGLRAYGVYPAKYLSGHMIHSLPTNTIFAVVEQISPITVAGAALD